MNSTTRRRFLKTATALTTATLTRVGFSAGTSDVKKVDACIYGGTSGGIIAAVTLAKLGRSVLLVEPTRHLCGMTSSGLGLVDFGKADSVGGLTKKYFDAVRDHYAATGVTNDGWHLEPHVAEQLFEKWVAEHRIEVVREARLAAVKMDGRRVRTITLDKAPVDERGAPAPEPLERGFLTVEAAIFFDCSYEGDLLAQAGVKFRADREARSEFGESLAGTRLVRPDNNGNFGPAHTKWPTKALIKIDPYVRPGDPGSGLLPLVSAAAITPEGSQSNVTQAYNFRLCLTKDDPIPIAAPSNYDPQRYELVRRYLAALEDVGDPLWPGDIYYGFDYERRHWHPRLLKITKLVNGKTDVNNAGLLSTDYVTGGAERYATATWPERAKLWHAHEDYQRGLLYFLRTDERMPGWLRSELSQWGLPKDEFRDTGGWPFQLYVREARRMISSYVMSQNDCDAPSRVDESIGFGSYNLDSHLCQRLVQDRQVISEGGFYQAPQHQPYPIPYSVIVPRAEECENLFVTFCVSSTHVAFASFRMEPAFMILSESAALAADQALREGTSVQNVRLDQLRNRLREAGQKV
jgi:hypothetical protein